MTYRDRTSITISLSLLQGVVFDLQTLRTILVSDNTICSHHLHAIYTPHQGHKGEIPSYPRSPTLFQLE